MIWPAISIAISTTYPDGGEYAQALRAAGAVPRMLAFDPAAIDIQLVGSAGVVLSGGGDVDPRQYGVHSDRAGEISAQRDVFELALVHWARKRALPTLCICRGLQVANVAFGGTLVPDISDAFGAETAARHLIEVDGESVRGVLAVHDVEVAADSNLAAIVGGSRFATGSRHHQSIAAVAPDLRTVGATADGIIEAVEARFDSPFWLGVQWHPESTLTLDTGASRAIFAAFVAAAQQFARAPLTDG